MVTKPLPEDGHTAPGGSSQQPPRLEDMRRELWSPSESEASASQAWASEPLAPPPPPPPPQDTISSPSTILRPGGIAAQNSGSGFNQEEENIWAEHPPASAIDPQRTGASDIPAVLQPAGGAAPVSQTNPFKRKPAPGVAQTPVNVPSMPSPTFDSPSPPTAVLDNLSVADTSNNPWKPALDSARQSPAPPAPALLVDVADEDPGTGAWASRTGSAQASRRPSDTPGTGVPGMPGMPEEPSAGWDEVAPPRDLSISHSPASAAVGSADNVVNENRQAWGGGEQEPKDKGKAPVIPTQTRGRRTDAAGEEWSLIDGPVPGQMSRQSTWENFSDEDEPQPSTSAPKKKVEPALPLLPRESSAEQSRSPEPPPQPPRPTASDKTETYQIKVINWYDANAPQNPRASPILVQNANGPCPLVALVNSLTLTSKPNTSTSLVETLRSREQVSLDLLLGAVVEELIIRTTDRELPDVTELYKFLKGLHTGMNVNPRYYPTEEASKALKRTSLTHLHPTERDGQMPGTFEHTREMQLYSTFAIPLIHGWIPSPEDNALASLKRHAASYEDVQNLLFREEELEQKLSSPDEDGLTEDEQELYHDILTIKSFLDSSATQLTPFGLDVVGKSMLPGSVAILFRNDHFSTLYRHPQTLALLSLVTDAGYASHDEIVWESLVDVNGERAEFFSGDFRLVGGAHHQEPSRQRVPGGFPTNTNSSASSAAGGSSNAGWTTVQSRRGKQTAGLNLAPESANPSASGSAPPVSPHEQEDRDLALALQLQEEEDERARVAEARRHRESQLSQQFIESQGSNNVNVHLTGNRNSSNNLRPGTAGTRRSSNASGVTTSAVSPVTVHGRRASGAAPPRQQVVRPLVPPAGTPVTPNTGRRTGTGREEEEPPPPTYEQAAMDEPYTPPAGHPSHFASSLTDRVTGRRQRQSGSGGNGNGAGPNANANSAAAGASGAGRGQGIPQPIRPLRQGVPPPLSSGPINQQQRERDCIVM